MKCRYGVLCRVRSGGMGVDEHLIPQGASFAQTCRTYILNKRGDPTRGICEGNPPLVGNDFGNLLDKAKNIHQKR